VAACPSSGGCWPGARSSSADNDAERPARLAEQGDRRLGGPSAAPSTLATAWARTTTPTALPVPSRTSRAGRRSSRSHEDRRAEHGQLDDLLSLGTVPTATTRADNAGLVPTTSRTPSLPTSPRLAAMTDAARVRHPTWNARRAKPDLILVNDSLGDLYPSCRRSRRPSSRRDGINWKRDLLLVGDAIARASRRRSCSTGSSRTHARRRGAVEDLRVDARFTPAGPGCRCLLLHRFHRRRHGPRPAQVAAVQAISEDIGAESIDKADGDWIFYSGRATPPRRMPRACSPVRWEVDERGQGGPRR